MDHIEAVRLQAAVKYVLGELPQAERDSFEEHYFDCAECAVDMQAAAVFAENARNVLRQEARDADVRAAAPAGSRWLAWFKPVVAVPAFAVLLLFVAYQNVVTIPRAREGASARSTPILFNSYPLRGVNTAGEEGRTLAIRPDETFFLNFDFVPTRSFDNYIAQLEDANGHVLLQSKIAGGNANQEAHLPIAGGMLRPGKYVLAFHGDPDGKGKVDPQNDAGRLPFIVELRP